jgi:uncharacterized membrane protein HdeD (DUF308 family)
MTARRALADVLDTLGRSVRWLGMGMIGLGLLAIVAPLASGAAVMLLMGGVLLLAGLCQVVFGWWLRSNGKGSLGLVLGAITGLCGLVLLVNPTSSVSVITVIVGLYLVVHGVWATLLAARLAPADGWQWEAGDGVVSMLLGASIWMDWPLSGVRAVGVVIGVKLVSAGAVVVRLERSMTRMRERSTIKGG